MAEANPDAGNPVENPNPDEQRPKTWQDRARKHGEVKYKDVPNNQVLPADYPHVSDLGPDSIKSYPMESRPRGQALVVSNIYFDNHDYDRHGGEADEMALSSLLLQLGFQVEVKRDLNAKQMEEEIKKFAESEAHEKSNMAVLAVMTHGNIKDLWGVDNITLTLQFVKSCFTNEKAPFLAGKLKWLLFQSCRLGKIDGEQEIDGLEDMFLTFSTQPSYTSARNTKYGTILVRALCQVFAEAAQNESLYYLHPKVQKRMKEIQEDKPEEEKETCDSEQIGVLKHLYFNPGLHEGYARQMPEV